MSTSLDLPTVRRVGSLSIPSPSPPPMSTASNSRSVSRSSEYGGQDSKRLSFHGQMCKSDFTEYYARNISMDR